MCGICGFLRLNSGGMDAAGTLINRMTNSLAHRGPDDCGTWSDDRIALGSRRLAVIDLSPAGHQPMSNENGTVHIVYNGETYNFRELKERFRLAERGHVFRSRTDTEVLVHLYEELGVDCLARLRGMFAIALWDARQERLILARDRIGKKPLYVYRSRQRLLFASEVKAILPELPTSPSINPDALREYLALGYVPAPKTLFAGIEKLLPGHLLTITADGVEDRRYWDVSFGQIEQRTEQEWTEQLQEKILEAIRIRLVSDVPLGAFLSGGLDSGTIVALGSRTLKQSMRTFTLGFDQWPSDERAAANETAQRWQTEKTAK